MPRRVHFPPKLTAAEFRSELVRLGITQQWYAEQTGASSQAVSDWATGDSPVPQHVWYTLQLLDRLAYRDEVRDVSDQVEAFVKLITSQTLAPSSHVRDANPFTFTTQKAPVMVPVNGDRPYRVQWRDPDRPERMQERWYSHDESAYRQTRRLRKLGIIAKVERLATAA